MRTRPQAAQLLSTGQLSAAHVGALAPLSTSAAKELLTEALTQDCDTFKQTVARKQLADTPDLPGRQRKARSLVFRVRNDQMITFKGSLEPIIGAEFRGLINHRVLGSARVCV
jgi:hypothetical protein